MFRGVFWEKKGRLKSLSPKLLQLARERWFATHDTAPGAADLATLSGLPVADIFAIDPLALASKPLAALGSGVDEAGAALPEPATAHDEIEARVDTAGLLLVRLERFFATLPERERQVIDAYPQPLLRSPGCLRCVLAELQCHATRSLPIWATAHAARLRASVIVLIFHISFDTSVDV